MRHTKSKKVLRLPTLNFSWHHAILEWVELDQIGNKATAIRVDTVVGLGLRIENDISGPIDGSFCNCIYFVNNVLPKGTEIRRTREDTRHANYGYTFRVSLHPTGTPMGLLLRRLSSELPLNSAPSTSHNNFSVSSRNAIRASTTGLPLFPWA